MGINNASSVETLMGIKTDEDFFMRDIVRVEGDIESNANLFIEAGSDVVIYGNVLAACIYIGDRCKVYIAGSINSGLVLNNNSEIRIEKNANVNNSLRLMNNTNTFVQGNLLVQNTRRIKIGDGVLLEVNQRALLFPYKSYFSIRIEIGDDCNIRIMGNLIAAMECDISLRKGWNNIIIGRNTHILVNCSIEIDSGYTQMRENSSLSVGRDLIIRGELNMLNQTTLKVNGHMTKIGFRFNVLNDCDVQISKDLLMENEAFMEIGFNSNILITGHAKLHGGVYIKKLAMLRLNRLSVRGGAKIESNVKLLVTNGLTFSGQTIIESNCSIVTNKLFIDTNICVFGINCVIQTNLFECTSDKLNSRIIIGSDSYVYAGDTMKTKILSLGSNVRLNAKDFSSYKVFIGPNSKLDLRSILIKYEAFVSENCNIQVYDGVRLGTLCIGPASSINVNDDMLIDNKLIVGDAARVTIKKCLKSNTIIMGNKGKMIVCKRLDSSIHIGPGCRLYFNELVSNHIEISSDSILLVYGQLFTSDLLIDSDEALGTNLDNEILDLQNEAHALLPIKRPRLSMTNRVTVGSDAHISNLIEIEDKSLCVLGDLYLINKCSLDKQLVESNNVIYCSIDTIKSKIDKLRTN